MGVNHEFDSELIAKYAELVVGYCLEVQPGHKIYLVSTVLAMPLLKEVYKASIKRGAYQVEVKIILPEEDAMYFSHANQEQLDYENPIYRLIMETFDSYLYIRAPYDVVEGKSVDKLKLAQKSKANAMASKAYSERTAAGTMRRSLCQYPTQSAANLAEMTLEEYANFIFNACKLNEQDPAAAWSALGKSQQKIVDFLNTVNEIRYVNNKSDITFSVAGRKWINSDGKANMPSGEVYSGPVEDSVNGTIYFDVPSMYSGTAVAGIQLIVQDGYITEWSADKGKALLDEIFQIEGARRFGEVAIGTNYGIDRPTKNILFDEKIGGTVHMAVGQSYYQTGGVNDSTIHWDMIASMKDGGRIYADGQLIYENGYFIGGLAL